MVLVEERQPSSAGGTTNTMTESPYFAKAIKGATSSTPSPLRRIEKATSSPYFVRSPASVHGSYAALGPIVSTWVSSVEDWSDTAKSCVYSSSLSWSSERQRIVCERCQSVLSEAMDHFGGCPQMMMTTMMAAKPKMEKISISNVPVDGENELLPSSSSSSSSNTSRRSCLQILGPHLEQQVRHLCRNQCYLRAYGPCRDWWTLRQSLLERTDRPIHRLLRCWTCKLDRSHRTTTTSVLSTEIDDGIGSEGGDPDNNRPAKRLRGSGYIHQKEGKEGEGLKSFVSTSGKNLFQPRTVFINRQTGKNFSSAAQVIRTMCLDELVSCQNEGDDADVNSWDVKRPYRPLPSQTSGVRDDAVNKTECKETSLHSPLGLLEELFGDDPWRLLLSTILLNRTRRNQVDGVLSQLLDRWPTPQTLINMTNGGNEENVGRSLDELITLIGPLGIKNRRARGIVRFCEDYVDLVTQRREQEGLKIVHRRDGRVVEHVEFQFTREEILNLYHCGDYCADAYQIFVQRDWENLHPTDHALRAYVEWQNSQTDLLSQKRDTAGISERERIK